ncbi:helix-turn-helix domain-containing protein, partial [Nocardioides sp.]|uniref:helix-turn-helix domain-containing protein n=1 Tax=Nocardioides sp. TaxID=35761 RepID=UPI002D7F7ED7
MSFSEESVRLLRLVDGGVPVPAAAEAVGISKGRAYELLKDAGRGRGPKTRITDEHRRMVVAEYDRTGSINRAARVSGLSHNAARRILVNAGLVPAAPAAVGKPDAKARFLELVGQGWSARGAAREVGVHPRTGQDWARGIRKNGNKRFHPDGVVVDYDTGTRYIKPMTPSAQAVISDRYLSLDERLAIADGLVNKHTLTRIAADVGRNK